MRIIKLLTKVFLFIFLLLTPWFCRAMPPGTLLYRTSTGGKMYGYSGDPLIYAEKGIIKNVYSGHVGIYIGKENGEDYIVEALGAGIVKTPAKYFINSSAGEKFLGAKIPEGLNPLQQAKVVAIAKNLAGRKLGYDFDFKKQKGPGDGEWTCVGLTEKLYESADISNPNNLDALEYDPDYYAINITPDGFDNYSKVNKDGDCFSRDYEFSKIARQTDLFLPAPELIGFNAGLEYKDERYIFLPYTQFLQPTLNDVKVDITVASSFSDSDVRGPNKDTAIILRWSLINNPLSSLKKIAGEVKNLAVTAAAKTKELAQNLSQKIFGSGGGTEIVLDNSGIKKVAAKTTAKKATAVAKTTVKKTATPKITVNKAASSPAVAPKTSASKAVASPAPKETAAKATTTKKTTKTTASKATTTASKATSTSSSAVSSSAITAYSQQIVPSVSVSSGGSGSSSSNISNASSASLSDNWPKIAQINKIYSTGNNDWVKLFNPTDHDFDLAVAGYRLEKAKTAQDPSLIIRLGNSEDGTYPGGTVIKAHDYYLIVRDDANDYYKNQADAIATRDDFNWTGSGYTIYLGTDAINSFTDPDIVDAIGFGPDATYFQGNGPASEITDNYVLNRLTNTGDNQADFNLILSDDPAVIASLAANSSDEAVVSIDETATSTNETDIAADGIATSTPSGEEDSTTSTDDVATTTDDIIPEDPVNWSKLALINKIYSTGNNDWLELFNPTDHDFDLAAAEYRLEKTKTAQDPSLIMRLGNTEDGIYPNGTIIKAHDNYLIVRDDANDYYKNQADAIATRDEFGWTGSGYTLYIGTGAISSNTDPDIIDAVGFGPDATYFQGNGPTPEISDNYILNRVANSGNNNLDFNLILADDPSIVIDSATSSNATSSATSPLNLYVPPTPIQSDGLTNLWHFNECYGAGKWAVGKWDCAREIGFTFDKLTAPLTSAADLNSFSVSFYYHKSFDYPRLDLRLSNANGDKLRLALEPAMVTIEGLPNSEWRYYPNAPFDDLWHQATLVVNQAADYWAMYIDGQEVIKENFLARLPIMTALEVSGDCGSALIDELAIWNRPLEAAEISANYSAEAPFSPLREREPQQPAELVHLWNFEEDAGAIAADSVGSSTLNVRPELWTGRSHNNYAITASYGKDFTANLDQPLTSKDLSLAFWWRNSSYPNPGRANIYLLGGAAGNTNLFALLTDYYRIGFWFNSNYGILAEGINKAIPYDDAWHHLALVYDSYRYKLSFYVDGEEKASFLFIWIKDGEEINRLKINSDSYGAAIDDLGIWEGALSSTQVKEIYLESK